MSQQFKINLRDGEAPVIVKIGDVEVHFGVTDFHAMVRCALMDLGNDASDIVSDRLYRPLRVIENGLDHFIVKESYKKPTDEQMAANLKRYHETGSGGVTNLQGFVEAIKAL